MKNKLFIFVVFAALTASIYGQSKFSAGVVVSRFENLNDNSTKMSLISHPLGYGVIGGYNINNDITLALTIEYFKGDIDGIDGKETDYRGHFSAYYHPLTFAGFKPYLSAGLVVAYRTFDYTVAVSNSDSKTNIYGRFGCGIDYPIIPLLSLNVDCGFYNDGTTITGWSGSLGVRFSL